MVAAPTRTRRLLIGASLLCLWLALALAASAQPPQQDAEATETPVADTRPPTIIRFTSDLPAIRAEDLDAGDTLARLSWYAVGLQNNQRLVLDRYELNTFVSLMNPEETTLPLNGSRVITVTHSASFAPPTYRLAVLDFRNRVIDQQIVTIQIIPPDEGTTSIETFEADMESVAIEALRDGSARVSVSWDVANRPPTANLVFEQVFSDGSAVSVELPRPFLYVPSTGNGVVAPVEPDESNTVLLRLRVVDVITNAVYAEETISLSVTGLPTPIPPTPEPEEVAIVAFTATPETVAVGEMVQLLWQVTGNVTVQVAVETEASGGPQVIANGVPKNAGLVVPVTAETFSGVDAMTFTLRLLDEQGEILDIATIVVDIGGGGSDATAEAAG